MPTIASENLKNIRQGLNVYIHVQQMQNLALTVTTSTANISDTTSIQSAEIDLAGLADLQGFGFPLDGSRRPYDPSETASLDGGKVGIRSNIGSAMTIDVSASAVINALTLRVFGEGTISADGVTYDIREFVVIPVNARNITLTATPEADSRIVIEDMIPGITLDFDNSNLIQCVLDLESDLSLTEASFPISSIEVQGYYPDDISEAVSNMGDGVPIIYYSGYDGDYSKPRYFYVSEAVTQKNGLITIKGEDASARLDEYEQGEVLIKATRQNVRSVIYNKMASMLSTAKINLVSKEANPPSVGTNTTEYAAMLKVGKYRDYIQYFMDITNKNGFFPRFVDAGIPTLRWSEPTPKWDIYKKDIGDFERSTERNINRIVGDDEEFPLHCTLVIAKNKTTLENKAVTENKKYTINFEQNYYTNITMSNATTVEKTLHSLTVRAKKTTQSNRVRVLAGWTKHKKTFKKGADLALVIPDSARKIKKTKSKNHITITWEEPKYSYKTVKKPMMVVKGQKINVANVGHPLENEVSSDRLGVKAEVHNLMWGRFMCNNGSSAYYIPKYEDIFNFKSNKSGSFVYKGNPHMQPRDVFRLYELDGQTYTVCTIESIETTHEEGGMSSKITYREGVY